MSESNPPIEILAPELRAAPLPSYLSWTPKGHLVVQLTDEQQREAIRTAIDRHRSQEARPGRVDWKARQQDDGLILDVRGALGELAVSLAFGLVWDGRFKPMSEWAQWRVEGHDVSGLEVKTTKLPEGSLIMHRASNPEQPFVLAILESASSVRLVGWAWGHEGQQEDFWRENVPRPCYMVPQVCLNPMVDLLGLLGLHDLADRCPPRVRITVGESELAAMDFSDGDFE
jgi:hypothetical protein